MEQTTSALIAAAIGATAGMSGGIILERIKRSQERRGVAMALAGAIEYEIWIIERRGHIAFFEQSLERVRAGEEMTFRGFVDKDHARNQIADALLEKIGMLPGKLPADVIKFFQTMWGIRIDLARLVAGEFGSDNDMIAHVISQDLELGKYMMVFGTKLSADLRKSAEGVWVWLFGSSAG